MAPLGGRIDGVAEGEMKEVMEDIIIPVKPRPLELKVGDSSTPPHHLPVARVKFCCRVFLVAYYLAVSSLFVAVPALLIKQFGFSKGAGFQALCLGIERGINFAASPILGVLSDHIGRKPVIAMSILVTCVPLGALGLWPGALTFLVYYTCVGFNSVLFMVYTIMTDISDPQSAKLAGVYGKLNVAICIGMVTGPIMSGFLAKTDVLLPIRVSAGLLVFCLLILFFLPETRNAALSREAFNWGSVNPIQRILNSCGTRRFRLLGIPYFILSTAESVYIIFVLYIIRRYGWSKEMVGVAISVLAISQATVQGSIKYVVPRYISDRTCAIIGLSSHLMANVVMGISPKGWMLGFAVIFMMGGGLKSPAMLGLLTANAPEKSRGTLQGSLQSLRALSLVVAGPLYAGLLSYAAGPRAPHLEGKVDWIMGLPYYVAALMDMLAITTALIAFRRLSAGEDEEDEETGKISVPPTSPSTEEPDELLLTPELTLE